VVARGDLRKLPISTLVQHIKTFREQLGALEDEVLRRIVSHGDSPQTPGVQSRALTQELSRVESLPIEASGESAMAPDSAAAKEDNAEVDQRASTEVFHSLIAYALHEVAAPAGEKKLESTIYSNLYRTYQHNIDEMSKIQPRRAVIVRESCREIEREGRARISDEDMIGVDMPETFISPASDPGPAPEDY